MERPDDPYTAEEEASASTLPQRFQGILRGIVLYLQARKTLVAIEASEAKSYLISRLILVCCALLCLTFGYASLLVGGVWWLSKLLHMPWWLLTLFLVPVHLLLGYVLLKLAARAPREALFQETRNELRKDKEWLTNPNEPWW